jgi:predicted RecB family nuclease
MNTYSNKEEDYKKKAFLTQKSSTKGLDSSSPDIVDNRPEVLFQRKLQEKADSSTVVNETSQLQAIADNFIYQNQPLQRKENTTGLPDDLKSGIENLSGYSMDDVKVHRNSDKPKQLQAHAYAQGTEIHLGSGQEKHLPHEAWHVVQQKQGRVKPTTQLAGGAQIYDNGSI